MADKYICIRKCYLHGKLWDLGDVFEPMFEGAEPNKHFALNGVVQIENRTGPMGPGDDPRSTVQIKADLEALTNKKPDPSWNRKQLFWAWVDAARENGQTVIQEPAQPSKKTYFNEQNAKMFSEMSPDDIENMKADDMRSKLESPPYSLDLGRGYVNKTEMVKRGIEIEEAMKINAMNAAHQ